MLNENWEIGRSIQEIREKKFPSSSEKQEIEKEVRKKSLKAQINLTQLKQTQPEQNIISLAQLKTNDIMKIKRVLLCCFKYLMKIMSRKILSLGREDQEKEHQKNRIQILLQILLRFLISTVHT